jgi:hypothetical protein
MKTKFKTAISINAAKWNDFIAALEWFRETNRSSVIQEMIDAFVELADHAKQKDIKRMPRLEFKQTDS